MTSVLVTGATTTLGRKLVASLLDDASIERVLAVGIEPLDGHFGGPEPRFRYHRVDLTRQRQLRRFMGGPVRDAGVTVIVHGSLHRKATDTGKKIHRLNVRSTRDLLDLAERHPTVRRFVFRSHVSVYKLRGDLPDLVREDRSLQLDGNQAQWLRDRVEADLAVTSRIGLSKVSVAVLRCAECPIPGVGSQLFDYLQSAVCLKPLGYDPMINLCSPDDLVRALTLAVTSGAQGVFNIPGRDTLPLSAAIRLARRRCVPVPGPLVGPFYKLRRLALGADFRYGLNRYRFHYNAVMDGGRAADVLGYTPNASIDWGAPSRHAV